MCSLGCLVRHVNEGQQVTTHKQREIHSLQLMKAFSASPTTKIFLPLSNIFQRTHKDKHTVLPTENILGVCAVFSSLPSYNLMALIVSCVWISVRTLTKCVHVIKSRFSKHKVLLRSNNLFCHGPWLYIS